VGYHIHFFYNFTFVVISFVDMENDMGGGQSLLKIDVLDKWAPFHSSNGSCASRLGCKPKGKRTYH
jgi:hypothetical protein